mmetsp:Transcript_75000/g.232677  ORF Transcript_75000/g.232677 Transcript_75000/m.232677 type:complete len:214 (-) Transcript_75000:162-803(-)
MSARDTQPGLSNPRSSVAPFFWTAVTVQLSSCPSSRSRPLTAAAAAAAVSGRDLELGQELSCTVTAVQKNGATLDLGLDRPGWVSLADIKEEWLEKVSDALSVGDKVKARVVSVKDHEVKVAMKDLPMFKKKPLSSLKRGDELVGKVVNVKPRALYVDVGAMIEGYIPVDQVPYEDIKTMAEHFKEGQELKVWVHRLTNSRLVLTTLNEGSEK